jgi:hypothetical protein
LPHLRRSRLGRWADFGVIVLLLVVAATAVAVHNAQGTRTSSQTAGTPRPTLASAPSPTPTATPISYFAPLSAGGAGWPVSASTFFKSDGFHITKGIVVPAPAPATSGFDVAVQARQIKGALTAGYGLAFRIAANHSHYEFIVYSDGKWDVYLIQGATRKALTPVAATAAIHRGLNATNVLEVQGSGTGFAFTINGQVVGQLDDATYVAGGVGLVGANGAEVAFINLALAGQP